MGVSFPNSVTVYCDGECCSEEIEVSIMCDSNNSTPFEDVLSKCESQKWIHEDGMFGGRFFCPECAKEFGLIEEEENSDVE